MLTTFEIVVSKIFLLRSKLGRNFNLRRRRKTSGKLLSTKFPTSGGTSSKATRILPSPINGLVFMTPENTNRLSSSKVRIPSLLLVGNGIMLHSLFRSNVLRLVPTQDALESGEIFLVRLTASSIMLKLFVPIEGLIMSLFYAFS